MTEAELDEILTLKWRKVIAWAKEQTDPWQAAFALSIRRQARKRSWFPSQKQQRIMRRMLQDQALDDRASAIGDDLFEVIE